MKDNELLVETNHEVLRHLASCAGCTRALQSRGRLKELVRSAVQAEPVPAELSEALKLRFRTERRNFFGHDAVRRGMAAAAVLLLAIGGLAGLQWGRIID